MLDEEEEKREVAVSQNTHNTLGQPGGAYQTWYKARFRDHTRTCNLGETANNELWQKLWNSVYEMMIIMMMTVVFDASSAFVETLLRIWR